MLKLIGALILAANVAANASIQATPSQHPPPAKTKTVGAEKSKSDPKEPGNTPKPSPLIVEAHVSGELQTTSDQTSQKTEGEHNRWLDPISIFTGLLVLVGVGQVWFLRNTDRATTKAAEAAKQSADAVVAQMRAYISMKTTPGIVPTFHPVAGARFAFDITNSGATPAFNMAHSIRAAIGPPEYEGDFPMQQLEPHKITLAPHATINISTIGPEPIGDDAQRWLAHELAAYVYGEITYTDASGKERYHRYRYRFMAPNPQTGTVALTMTLAGNEAN